MSNIEINVAQFPGVLHDDIAVGEEITLTVAGRVQRIEDDLVDVREMGGKPAYLPGARTVEITITDVRAHYGTTA